ncbi:MAG: hypothetical protein KatS3mg017_0337 [Fimbriimonadales bacterium]|nr:MAG: hypothetical protein KatS3mg017_0337 [Fimbriimonadales bacterium]
MRVYVDTSAFLAVLNPRDLFHAAARESWVALLEGEATLVCSNYVLLETIALVQRRMGLETVRAFVENVLPVVQVVWGSEADLVQNIQPDVGVKQSQEPCRSRRRDRATSACCSCSNTPNTCQRRKG